MSNSANQCRSVSHTTNVDCICCARAVCAAAAVAASSARGLTGALTVNEGHSYSSALMLLRRGSGNVGAEPPSAGCCRLSDPSCLCSRSAPIIRDHLVRIVLVGGGNNEEQGS